ncbi:hypothetical protein B0T18DRAFT_440985 [Schizothecium vesticola]|uniref:Enoyl reductase (ER) domain-containing protein n=1 Tax=Schizothecium vesticola TaxID=314040 RepID=A0AA40BPW5_9PEZI|nr:hypothetical protein B0T18DRAFT_440985 [Schizothecium vesticola]
MPTTTNKTLIFKKVPAGLPVAGEHLTIEDRAPPNFDPSTAAPPNGGLALSILYASYDPYLRGKMRPSHIKSYSPAFELDSPVTNATVARVVAASDGAAYAVGDLVIAHLPLAEYAVLTKEQAAKAVQRKVENPHGLDLAVFLGPLGMPGLTGWSALYEIGKPKKGETIFISSAAGAVGQVVGQVAKREGLRVIGSVGSDDKLEFILKEMEFDGGWNYKKEGTKQALERLAPDGLEATIDRMNQHGRLIECGMISQYNLPAEKRYPIKNMFLFVSKRLKMEGFIVGDENFGPKHYKEHQEKMQKWLADGSVKAKIHLTEGIDKAADGFVDMLEGRNFGKAVLKIKDE